MRRFDLWDRHPLLANAVRTAVAVPVSWLIVQWLPSPVGDYPYYAPMGAVIAASTNPGGSLKTGAQAVAAITLGGLAAIVADLVGDPDNVLPMAAAVLIAVLITGWGWLGSMASWVPTAAVFTLLIGGGDFRYLALYTGILLIGAVVATLVTLATPGQPLVQAQERLEELRDALTAYLDTVINAVQDDRPVLGDGPPSADLSRARTAVTRTRDAVNANPRVRRHQDHVARAQLQLQVYEHLVEAFHLIARLPHRQTGGPPPPVRAAAVHAVETLRFQVSRSDLWLAGSQEQAKDTAMADLQGTATALERALEENAPQHWLAPAGILLAVTGTHHILHDART